MDLTLLWISIALIVIGFLVSLFGTWLRSREPGIEGITSLPDLIAEAIRKMFSALTTALNPNQTLGQRVQGIGSLFAWMGMVLFIVFIANTLLGGQTSSVKTPTTSPAPSAS